jgi:hypothetical protein
MPARKSWAGHVMLTSHCGRAVYTKQFPHKPGEGSSFSGSKRFWTYEEVMQNAKYKPASIWAITVLDHSPIRLNHLSDQSDRERMVYNKKIDPDLVPKYPPVITGVHGL